MSIRYCVRCSCSEYGHSQDGTYCFTHSDCTGFIDELPPQKNQTADGKQLVGNKLRKRIEKIVGNPVVAAFVNGPLPHNLAQAWVNNEDCFIVNLKTNAYADYIIGGDYMLRRVQLVKKGTKKSLEEKIEQTWINKAQELIKETGACVPLHLTCGEVCTIINGVPWCEVCGLTPASNKTIWVNRNNVSIYVPQIKNKIKERTDGIVERAFQKHCPCGDGTCIDCRSNGRLAREAFACMT